MIIKKATKWGSSYVLVLDKIFFKMSGLKEGCDFKITVNEGKIIIESVS